MPRIIVDRRENKELIKELVKEEIDVEVKQLEIADFIIRTKDLENKIQTVGIERKTINDLLNSIIDKRLINQLILLKENFDIALLIIEGDENIYAIRDFHPNAIRGIIISVALDFQIPIIYTKNHRDTAKYLVLIAKRLEKIRKPLSLIAKRKPITIQEQQQYILESFPGIGPTIAGTIKKNFKSMKEFTNATEKDLQKVEKIGKHKAREIVKVLEKEFKN